MILQLSKYRYYLEIKIVSLIAMTIMCRAINLLVLLFFFFYCIRFLYCDHSTYASGVIWGAAEISDDTAAAVAAAARNLCEKYWIGDVTKDETVEGVDGVDGRVEKCPVTRIYRLHERV